MVILTKTLKINNFNVMLQSYSEQGPENYVWASVNGKHHENNISFARQFTTEDEAIRSFTKTLRKYH